MAKRRRSKYDPIVSAFGRKLDFFRKQQYELNKLPSRFHKIAVTHKEAKELKEAGFKIKLNPRGRVTWITLTTAEGKRFASRFEKVTGTKIGFVPGLHINYPVKVGGKFVFVPFGKTQMKYCNAAKEINKGGEYPNPEKLAHALSQKFNVSHHTAAINLASIRHRLDKKGVNSDVYFNIKTTPQRDFEPLLEIFKERIPWFKKGGYELSKLPPRFATIPIPDAKVETIKKAGFKVEFIPYGTKEMHVVKLKGGDFPAFRSQLDAKKIPVRFLQADYVSKFFKGKHIPLPKVEYDIFRAVADIVEKEGIYNQRGPLVTKASKKLGITPHDALVNFIRVETKMRKAGLEPKKIFYQTKRQETPRIEHGLTPAPEEKLLKRKKGPEKAKLETDVMLTHLKREIVPGQIKEFRELILEDLKLVRARVKQLDEKKKNFIHEATFVRVGQVISSKTLELRRVLAEKQFKRGTQEGKQLEMLETIEIKLLKRKEELEREGKKLLKTIREERKEEFYDPRRAKAAKERKKVGK